MSDKTSKYYYADYGHSSESSGTRPEYRYIADWIEKGSKVLDLGCGGGSLGSLFIKQKDCEVHGDRGFKIRS